MRSSQFVKIVNNDCSNEEIEPMVELLKSSYPEAFEIDTSDKSEQLPCIILIFFKTKSLNRISNEYLTPLKDKIGKSITVIPVSVGGENFIEDDVIGEIKTLNLMDRNSPKILHDRVGAFLGLKCIPKENHIFVSYKKSDGEKIAIEVSKHLKSIGFNVWRDEDRDEDGEGNLKIGMNVQEKIKGAIENSNTVLLIDTPEVHQSKWVDIEIDHAHANLIPVLPICFPKSPNKGSHFRKLRALQRYCQPTSMTTYLTEIDEQLSTFLSEVYKRKKDIPIEVAKKFTDCGYSWSPIDSRKLLFESEKTLRLAYKRKLLSQCPIYYGLHDELIHNFLESIRVYTNSYNDKVLIYDGLIMTEREILEIFNKNPAFEKANIAILHHEQILEFLNL